MTKQPSLQLRKPELTTFEFYRLIDIYVRAGEEIAGRPWRMTADAMRRVTRRVELGLLGPWSAGQVMTGLAEEYANLMLGLLSAAPTAIENITTGLNNPPPDVLTEYRVSIAGAQPEEFGTLVQVGDNNDTPFILPARVVDASQGWAAWFVPKEKVVALMEDSKIEMQDGQMRGRIDAAALENFEPLDCGDGRCMVVLLGVDYQVTDCGRYLELALAICVTPREAAAQPGSLFARLLVSDRFSVEPSRRVWGFHKDFFEDLQVYYGKSYAQFYTGQGATGDFFLTVPRFGTGRSFEIPLVIYSVRDPDINYAIAGPTRTIMARNGTGEGAQIGGTVELQLGTKSSGTCFCGKPDIPCLCDQLRTLGIDKTLPAANGWTERMTGEIGAPGPLHLHPFGNH